MSYESAYLWERGREKAASGVSLVLQQAVVKKQEVLLACVCESKSKAEQGIVESGYFTEGLTEWFHRELLKLCEKKSGTENLSRVLEKEIKRLQKEVGQYAQKKGSCADLHYIIMVLWRKQFWLFTKGYCEGYLLNRRFNKKHMKQIRSDIQDTQETILQGGIQKKVGILLCTNNYFRQLDIEEAAEVLGIEDNYTESRMQKRMQELWQENLRRGENGPVGAVYLRT